MAVSGQLAEQSVRPSFGGTGIGVLLAGRRPAPRVRLRLRHGPPARLGLGLARHRGGLIGLLSHVLKMPEFSTTLTLLIGLGVGIDYALFIVTRHRQGLIAGHDPESSIVTAVNTSGRAVLFAGIIVCIALLGMFALGVTFLYGLAVAAAIGVALTMIAALTLLPALLGFIGPRVLSRRQKANLAKNGPRIVGSGTKGFWPALGRHRPSSPCTSGRHRSGPDRRHRAAVLLVASRLGRPGNDPVGSTTRQAYDMLAQGFGPGFNGPLELVAVVRDGTDRRALAPSGDRCRGSAERGQRRTAPAHPGPRRHRHRPRERLPHRARRRTRPPPPSCTTSGRRPSLPPCQARQLTVLVGGTTAIFIDFAHVLSAKFPLFIGLVVLLSFLLLSVVFRSIVIPLVSAVMNILSIGAAFGILVSVFQWGWLGSLFGVNRAGPIEAFLPVMLFAILFGLSMDYQVFLVTRIHEEWLNTGDNRLAVRNGLAATGKTITAAALIMILVFGSFILGGERVIKEFGLGLAGGILVDAVVIRMAVVPSVMLLIGKANWWFPPSLDRVLPHIGLERTPTTPDSDVRCGGAPGGDAHDLVSK